MYFKVGLCTLIKLTYLDYHRLKQKFPAVFNDICFYSEVCHLLSMCSFRLNARRFVQELFEDFKLKKVCFLTLNLRNACGFWFYRNQVVHLFLCNQCVPTDREREERRERAEKIHVHYPIQRIM